MLNSHSLYKSALYPPSNGFHVEDTSLCPITVMAKWKDIKRFNPCEKQHTGEKKKNNTFLKKKGEENEMTK